MAVERTFSIIKPDAVAKNAIGQILSRFEAAGLKIIAARMMHLSRAQAEGFYAVPRERPFFKDLVDFMISGPVLVQVLQGEGAIAKNRELMGATDPKNGREGNQSAPTSPTRSTPMRCTARTRPKQRAPRSHSSSRLRDLSALTHGDQPSRPSIRRAWNGSSPASAKAVPRAPGPEVDPSPRRRRFRRH